MGYYDNCNSFIGYYVSDYSTVLNTSVPQNGMPILFADLSQGMLWSKKYVQGQAYIQPYSLTPINTVGEPSDPNDMRSQLDEIRKELNKLKEAKHESE